MKRSIKHIESLISVLIFILLILLLNRYIFQNQGNEIIELMEAKGKHVANLIDNRIGKCARDEIRIEVAGGYVCRRGDVAESVDRKIFDNYPLSAGGREVVYDFLDRGEIQTADLMLNNIYDLERYEPIKIDDVQWGEDPYNDTYWKFIFYSLRPTRNLLYAWRETGDERYRDKMVEILENYTDKGMDKEETWEDYHAVAFRSMVLVNAWWKLREEKALTYDMNEKLLKAIARHGEFLFDEKHYEPGYNHGVNESIALLLIATNFPDLADAARWQEVAVGRLAEGIDTLIDDDGALIENSPYYHFYVLEKYSQIHRYADAYHVHISDKLEPTVKKMVDYGTYILEPDSSVPLMGASMRDVKVMTGELESLARDNPELAYVLTRGASGDRPEKLNVSFADAGQAIMRSGWGNGRGFANQTYLVYNIGSYRTKHSDFDALNFVLSGKGRDLIVDSGLYSYEESDYKRYFDSTLAHNTVTVDDGNQLPGSVIQGGFYEKDGSVTQSASHTLYPGVTHYRTISMVDKEDVLIVDKLVSDASHSYKQMFHLASDLKYETKGSTVYAKDQKGRDVMQITQLVDEGITLSGGAGQAAPINGWCSDTYNEKRSCAAISYEQKGSSALFVTHIHIGAPREGEVAYMEGSDTLTLLKGNDASYRIALDIPETATDYQIKHEIRDIKTTSRSLELAFDPSADGWRLSDENKNALGGYLIRDNAGKLEIASTEDKNFTVAVDDVGTYYSAGNKATTDISFDRDKSRVYEQEDFIPILGYHHILNDDAAIEHPELEMHKKDFAAQISYLTDTYGCRWFTFADIMQNYVLKDKKTPKRACVINFDDGNRDNYTNAYPVLKDNHAIASFYIIPEKLEKTNGLSLDQLNELYINGNEVGSHTVGGGTLLAFKDDHDQLVYQIGESRRILSYHGYGNVDTFAYPLGEWNDEIVGLVKGAGYIAARDTSKDNMWRDRRAQTASMDKEYIWHMYYHKPEKETPEELVQAIGYNTWWQFEEGYQTVKDADKDITSRSSIVPTPTSFAVMDLHDAGDSIANKFLVSKEAAYSLEIFASAGMRTDPSMPPKGDGFVVNIDGRDQSADKLTLDPGSCVVFENWNYCAYTLRATLKEGAHVLTVTVTSDNQKFDKFRLFREIAPSDSFKLTLTESVDNGAIAPETVKAQINLDLAREKHINRYFFLFLFAGSAYCLLVLILLSFANSDRINKPELRKIALGVVAGIVSACLYALMIKLKG